MPILYGTEPSFYTRKAWVGLRLLGLPVEQRLKSLANKAAVEAAVSGYHRFPVLDLDGEWLVDSTDMLVTLSRHHPARSLLPDHPVAAVLAMIADDWMDEWLLRPAIAWRAADPATRRWVAERGARNLFGLAGDALAPAALMPKLERAIAGVEAFFVTSCETNGVTPGNHAAVVAMLGRALDALTAMFAERAWLFGGRPSIADAALWGMLDTGLLWEPAARAHVATGWPEIAAWHARLRTQAETGGDGGAWDDDFAPLERLLGGDAFGFATFQRANAAAIADGGRRVVIDGVDAPAREFTEKNRRRIGAMARALSGADAARLPDWPLIAAYRA